MTAKRNTYDTLVILLFILGREQTLPTDFVAGIPHSTRSGWRKLSRQKFAGSEFRKDFEQELNRAQRYQKYRYLKTVLNAVEEIYIALAAFIELVRLKLHDLHNYREAVCDLISKYSAIIRPEKLRKVFGISVSTHQRWLYEIKFRCRESFF